MSDTSIRLSEETKGRLERRKRGNERGEDASRRRSMTTGISSYGAWNDDMAETVSEIREEWKRESGDRIARIAELRDGWNS